MFGLLGDETELDRMQQEEQKIDDFVQKSNIDLVVMALIQLLVAGANGFILFKAFKEGGNKLDMKDPINQSIAIDTGIYLILIIWIIVVRFVCSNKTKVRQHVLLRKVYRVQLLLLLGLSIWTLVIANKNLKPTKPDVFKKIVGIKAFEIISMFAFTIYLLVSSQKKEDLRTARASLLVIDDLNDRLGS